jgi:hypothetical protein
MNNAATMTKQQVKKAMNAAGISGEFSGRGVNWEVTLADEKTMRRFCKLVVNVGGFRTGCGEWVMRPGYTVDPYDYCDTRSSIHY